MNIFTQHVLNQQLKEVYFNMNPIILVGLAITAIGFLGKPKPKSEKVPKSDLPDDKNHANIAPSDEKDTTDD